MLKKIVDGIFAGILVSIGGMVYLSCDNKYVGAVLFSIALLFICLKGYSLYTGKICYIPEKHNKEAFSVLLLALLGNFLATVICGYALRYAAPSIAQTALSMCETKLTQEFFQTFLRAVFCGILIYLAVDIYKNSKNPIGIFFAIPVFILSGYEHSIADMFYFAASGIVSLRAFGFIWTVILGNSIGGMLFPVLEMISGKEKANCEALNQSDFPNFKN